MRLSRNEKTSVCDTVRDPHVLFNLWLGRELLKRQSKEYSLCLSPPVRQKLGCFSVTMTLTGTKQLTHSPGPINLVRKGLLSLWVELTVTVGIIITTYC